MRKIGSITPIFNQKLFIRPHFDFLSSLDKNLVLLGNEPWKLYKEEHGYPDLPDDSEHLIRTHFPHVQFHQLKYRQGWMADLYNEGLELMQDYDLVLRLDADMMFTEHEWEMFIHFLRTTDYPVYRLNFSKNSINYYMNKRFDRGLKDSKEFDIIAIDPKLRFDVMFWVQNPNGETHQVWRKDDTYPKEWERGWLDIQSGERSYTIEWNGWLMHHYRGWNKLKSEGENWDQSDHAKAMLQEHGNNGQWYVCPDEIREKSEAWLREIGEL